MNTEVMFVKISTLTGSVMVPVSKVHLVQVSPNDTAEVVQDIPMVDVLDSLARHNLTSFARTELTREEWDERFTTRL